MSADRLFRVRCKQPYSSNVSHNQHTESAHPIISHSIQIGEMCVFKQNQGWAIGKVLQFSKMKEKTMSAQQYEGFAAEISKTGLGVLCCWYTPISSDPASFQMLKPSTHIYHPLDTYMCTLTFGCFKAMKY